MYGGIDDGGEAGLMSDAGSAFSEESIRRGFIRKVYGILSLQLILTGALIGFFYIPEVTAYAFSNSWLFWTAFAVNLACIIVLACIPNVRRAFPGNLICLSVFTLSMGVLLGSVSASYTADEVLMAVGICALMVIALTLFAWQTKFDFTMMGGVLLMLFLCLMIIGFVAIFVRNKILSIVYSSIGAFIFSCYILVDTQLMMGGKHQYALDPEEYIFAALNLYLDIVNLFLFILRIIGLSRN